MSDCMCREAYRASSCPCNPAGYSEHLLQRVTSPLLTDVVCAGRKTCPYQTATRSVRSSPKSCLLLDWPSEPLRVEGLGLRLSVHGCTPILIHTKSCGVRRHHHPHYRRYHQSSLLAVVEAVRKRVSSSNWSTTILQNGSSGPQQ